MLTIDSLEEKIIIEYLIYEIFFYDGDPYIIDEDYEGEY